MPTRARLTPAIADVRRAVRESLGRAGVVAGDLVLVACSGGADSLALAVAAGFEGARAGVSVGAVIVEHGLQAETAGVAARTAEVLRGLGLDPIQVVPVNVGESGGPEAAARTARYEALDAAAETHGAKYVLLGHTLDDQAETVLLGLGRGSGPKSLAGMSEIAERYLRPLLAIRRATTEAFCLDSSLDYWTDPQNSDPRFTRVKLRHEVLPLLETALGGGVAEALARTANLLRADATALDQLAEQLFAAEAQVAATSVTLDCEALAKHPSALSSRLIKLAIETVGGQATATAIDSVTALVHEWHGQKPLTLSGTRVERTGRSLVFRTTKTLKTGAC
jgi:tRNA(Ile)-lysidine synthase